MIEKWDFEPSEIYPGQDIIATKWIALEGTALLAETHAGKLQAKYPRWLINEAQSFTKYLSTAAEEKIAHELGIKAIHKAGSTGIFGALWKLAEYANVGLEVDLRLIPVRQETIEICNFIDINPYEYLSGGMLLLIHNEGVGLVEKLESKGITASVIGKTTDKNDRVVINKDRVRFLTPKPYT
jgi:hydrogenase maturation factor